MCQVGRTSDDSSTCTVSPRRIMPGYCCAHCTCNGFPNPRPLFADVGYYLTANADCGMHNIRPWFRSNRLWSSDSSWTVFNGSLGILSSLKWRLTHKSMPSWRAYTSANWWHVPNCSSLYLFQLIAFVSLKIFSITTKGYHNKTTGDWYRLIFKIQI